MAVELKPQTRTDVIFSVLIAIIWFAMTLQVFWNSWPPDFSAAYFAGHFYAIGDFEGVYAAPTGFFGPDFPQSWKDYAAELGNDDPSIYPFVYPPIWAALAAPLTELMGPYAFFNLFLVIQLLLTAFSVFLVHAMVRPQFPMAIWCIFSFALLWLSVISTSAFVHNQFQITVAFLTIWSFERFLAGKSVQSGAILAVAAAIKLSPAALFLIFLVERDKRAMVTFLAVGGALGLTSLAIAGIDLHLVFLERLREISSVIAIMKVNYNLEAFLVQAAALYSGAPINDGPNILDQAIAEPTWVTLIVRATLIAGVALVFVRTRNLARKDRVQLRQIGLLLTVTLCAPLAWTHHYLAPLILLPTLYGHYSFGRATTIIFLVGLITNVEVFVLLSIWSTVVHTQAVISTATFLAIWALFVFAPQTQWRNQPLQLQIT